MLHDMPEEQQRWFAVKIFERDEQLIEKLNIPKDKLAHIEQDIKACETRDGRRQPVHHHFCALHLHRFYHRRLRQEEQRGMSTATRSTAC